MSGPAITILAAHTAREVQVFPTVLNLNLPTGSGTSRFRLPSRVIAEPILGGLDHEYRWTDARMVKKCALIENTRDLESPPAAANLT